MGLMHPLLCSKAHSHIQTDLCCRLPLTHGESAACQHFEMVFIKIVADGRLLSPGRAAFHPFREGEPAA